MKREELKRLQENVRHLKSKGKYKESIEAAYNLLQRGWEIDDYKSILTAHITNAASYYCIGDIEEAFHSVDEYREICTKYGDEVDHLYLFNVLFLLYEYNRNFEKAKETLHKTITLGKKLNKFNIISNAYSNFSHILIEEKEYEKALEMGKVGLEMAALHKPASEMLAIRVQLNIALAYIHLGDLQSSEYIITNIIHNPILNEFIREKTECFMLKGEWYTSQNLYKEAFQSFTTAKELVESYQDVYLLKTIQEKRCELCERMSDFSLGYSVQKEYIRLLNTIRNTRN